MQRSSEVAFVGFAPGIDADKVYKRKKKGGGFSSFFNFKKKKKKFGDPVIIISGPSHATIFGSSVLHPG